MAQGPGYVELGIVALFQAHPDEAYSTAELAKHIYGIPVSKQQVGHGHLKPSPYQRVVIVRACNKIKERGTLPLERYEMFGDKDKGRGPGAMIGGELIFFRADSLIATAKAASMRQHGYVREDFLVSTLPPTIKRKITIATKATRKRPR
jgi:hypothetical protein